ncbi:hypothetical protein V6O07_04315, partial [Arthrospira platensis SPKY2]
TTTEELRKWDNEEDRNKITKLTEKPQLVVVSKLDLTEVKQNQKEISSMFKNYLNDLKSPTKLKNFEDILFVSSASQENLKDLVREIYLAFENIKKEADLLIEEANNHLSTKRNADNENGSDFSQ